MNSKNLLMILAIAIGSALLFNTSKEDYSEPIAVPDTMAAFADLDIDQVTRIEMTQGDTSVILERDESEWIVPSVWNYPGEKIDIEDLLADIRSITSPQQRASKPSSHSTFEIGEMAGLKISLRDSTGAALIDMVVGKRDGFQRSFIRLAGSDEVFSVSPNLRSRAGFAGSTLEAGRWTKKTLFELPQSAVVRRIHIQTPEESSLLTWKVESVEVTEESELLGGGEDPLWMVQAPADSEAVPADETTVKGIISSLKKVIAAEPVDPGDPGAAGLDPVTTFIEVELADGTKHTIQFGQESNLTVGGKGVAARVVGDSRVAMVREWTFSSLVKSGETLKAVIPDPPEDSSENLQPVPVPENVEGTEAGSDR